MNEGYEADSSEYYSELDGRIKKIFPQLQQSAGNEDGSSDPQPSVQRVASASAGSRQKTRAKNGVTFSKSERERLRGLKPHNMTEADWLKRVAVEKQKIAQREAM